MGGETKVACRTPAEGRDGVANVPAWKFEVVRGAILNAAREPILFKDLKTMVGERLDADMLGRLGSLGWHVTTVKLEMEVRGEIERLDAKGPQQIRATVG
ncbi:MAG: hypothetical protein AAFU55_17405 [Pseudomonadota bacterium]